MLLAGKTKRCFTAFPPEVEYRPGTTEGKSKRNHVLSWHLFMLVKCAEHFISGLAWKKPRLVSRLLLQAFRQHSEIEDYFAIKQPSKEKNESTMSGGGETLVSFSHTTQSPSPTATQLLSGTAKTTQKARVDGDPGRKRCRKPFSRGDIKETIIYAWIDGVEMKYTQRCLRLTTHFGAWWLTRPEEWAG